MPIADRQSITAKTATEQAVTHQIHRIELLCKDAGLDDFFGVIAGQLGSIDPYNCE